MNFHRGLILVHPHGTFIKNDLKSIVIKSKHFKNISHRPLLLIENKKGLGIIYLGDPKVIDLEQFRKKYLRHRILESERKKWWKGKRKLYQYDIIKRSMFAEPLNLDYKTGPQVVVKPESIKFLNKNNT